jgi:hypothetical protein
MRCSIGLTSGTSSRPEGFRGSPGSFAPPNSTGHVQLLFPKSKRQSRLWRTMRHISPVPTNQNSITLSPQYERTLRSRPCKGTFGLESRSTLASSSRCHVCASCQCGHPTLSHHVISPPNMCGCPDLVVGSDCELV